MANTSTKNNENAKKSKTNELGVFLVKFYRVIPKNCALIIENRFSGRDIKVISNDMTKKNRKGYAFVWPWKKAKLISVAEKTFDYEAMEFDDKDGQAVFVDFAVTVKIINPYRYEYVHENPEAQLKILLKSEMHILIQTAKWEELVGTRFEINTQNEPAKENGKKKEEEEEIIISEEFTAALNQLKIKLRNFAKKYGLLVTELSSKDVQQSKEMQKIYDEKIRKEKEMRAKLEETQRQVEIEKVEAEKTRIKAEADATKRGIQAEAEANAVSKYFRALKASIDEFSMSDDKKAELLAQIQNSYMLTHGNGNANLFAFMGNNQDSVKTGAVAGATTSAMDKGSQKTKKK